MLIEWLKTISSICIVLTATVAVTSCLRSEQSQISELSAKLQTCVPPNELSFVIVKIKHGDVHCEHHDRYKRMV